MKSPFANQRWFASTLYKQIIITKTGKKTMNKVQYDPNYDRVYAFYGKRAHTVVHVNDNLWREIED